jgi:serine/threonine protein phosphatase PrpC
VLSPDGIVLGLQIDGIASRFEQLLDERVVSLQGGDVLVFFTDGITEAMNTDADLFGETRLVSLVEQHGDAPTEVLRERIFREIEAFVGQADQHDDMTMILVRIEGSAAPVAGVAAGAVTASEAAS